MFASKPCTSKATVYHPRRKEEAVRKTSIITNMPALYAPPPKLCLSRT
jgi:hypothetical protein